MPKMKALVTYPGKAGTVEIIEVERPRVSAGEVLILLSRVITDQGGQDDARDRYRLHQRP